MRPPEGLTSGEAQKRLHADGANELPAPPAIGALQLLVHQLTNSMVALLAAAAALSIAIGESVDAIVIAAIVVGNAALGYIQEKGADEAARAVRDLLAPTAVAIRDGSAQVIEARELVVGDLVALRAGDRVGADGRVASARSLQVDESLLTGESLPAEHADGEAVYAGTTVSHGEARMVVTATGTGTELARIAAAASASSPRTPLERRLDRLTLNIVAAASGVCLIVAALAAWRGSDLEQSALIGISLAVAAVPEGLPAVVTVSLALGVRQMAERGAIVRQLPAVETLGSTDVICTDKTGTLTENRLSLTVREALDGEDPLAAALRASGDDESGPPDPLERALLDAARADGRERETLTVVDALPFDSVRKRSAVVVDDPRGGRTIYVKGAPEALLPLLAPFQSAERIEQRAGALAAQGARVLLVARRGEVTGPADEEERDLLAVGLLAFSDPPRPAARESLEAARRAGVRTIMVTGDHPSTALAINRMVGLARPDGQDRVVTGPEIDAASDAELRGLAERVDIYARVVPEHKLRLIEALRAQGHVVAMTGDGVNDVPALRAADIGVAMGERGSDAAGEAADIVLTDDDYSTIVAAVARGRAIYRNIRSFTLYLLAANAGEILVFAAAIAAGLGAPLTVVQILVVNLLTDGLPAVALAVDPPDPADMHRPPRPRAQGLLHGLGPSMALIGVAKGAAAFAALLIGRETDPQTGQTMAFTTLVVSQLVYVYSARTEGPAWRASRNRALDAAVALSVLVAALILAVPGLRELFDAVALDPAHLGVALALGLFSPAVAEVFKALRPARSP